MAKKTAKKVENKPANIQEQLNKDIETNINQEIGEIIEKVENLQETEEIATVIMNETPAVAQEIIENELKKIDNIKKEIEVKINEVIKENPNLGKMLHNSNSQFTYSWNGMFLE